MRYSPERKEAVLRKMVPPHNRTIKQLAQDEGISEATLFNWRQQARDKGILMPDGATSPEGWNARDKFAAVIESASLNENELGEYCRKKGFQKAPARSLGLQKLRLCLRRDRGSRCLPGLRPPAKLL